MGKLRDNLNLIFSNLLFGANFSIYVSLVRNWFDFRQLFLLQVGAAALFFIPFALLSPRTPRMRWADLKNILIVTVLIIYGWMYTMLWGATYTNPVDASILATLGPVFTLLIAVGMHREPFSWVRTLGVAAALCGAGILLFERGFHLVEGSEGWGNALVLIAVLSIAANTVIIKPQLQRFGTLWVMGWYYLIGVAITFPFFKDYIDLNRLYTLPPGALAETGILLIFGTVLPMYLLYRGTERLTSVHTALYRYIQPLVATTLALARHQETVDQIHLLAGGAIFGGVLLMVLGTVLARRKQRSGCSVFAHSASSALRHASGTGTLCCASKSKATMTERLWLRTVPSSATMRCRSVRLFVPMRSTQVVTAMRSSGRICPM